MDVTRPRRRLSLGRIMLLALVTGIAWCALSLMTSTSSASATEGSDQGSGLLGAVGQTVSGVGEVLSGTTAVVDEVVTAVVTPVTPAVAPLPAPVAEPVAQVVTVVTQTADQAVDTVDTAVTQVVDTATTTVADVADAGVVTQVVAPVVELVESVPVVGAAVEQTGLGGTVTGVAGGLDATVSTVVGAAAPVGSVLPALPVTGVGVIIDTLSPASGPSLPGDIVTPLLPAPASVPDSRSDVPAAAASLSARGADAVAASPPNALGARSGAPDGTAAPDGSVTTPAAGPSAPVHGHPAGGSPAGPGLAAPGSTGVGSNGAGGSLAALAHEDAHGSLHDFTILRTTIDDALPGAPVFDTDVSPD